MPLEEETGNNVYERTGMSFFDFGFLPNTRLNCESLFCLRPKPLLDMIVFPVVCPYSSSNEI